MRLTKTMACVEKICKIIYENLSNFIITAIALSATPNWNGQTLRFRVEPHKWIIHYEFPFNTFLICSHWNICNLCVIIIGCVIVPIHFLSFQKCAIVAATLRQKLKEILSTKNQNGFCFIFKNTPSNKKTFSKQFYCCQI